MCRQIQCNECGKPTWAGCGMHIEQTLAKVPKDQRCSCRETAKGEKPSEKKLFGLW